MPNTNLVPTATAERLPILDVLRGLAVAGILIGNVQWFSGYGMVPPVLAEQAPMVDKVTHFLVHLIVEGKFYSIFSFLFGFGFALQIARAEERGDTGASLFKRRLLWLLVIGALHACLLWAGDILSVYALMGFVLLLFRKRTDKTLLRWAFGLMIVPVVTYALLTAAFLTYVPPEEIAKFQAMQAEGWTQNVRTVTESSYLEIISGYNLQYLAGRWAGLIIQMRLPKILAMFLLGMYAYRRGVFQDIEGNLPFIRRVAVYGIAIGLVGNILMAALAGNEAPFPPSVWSTVGVAGYAFGVPALAVGIAALVTLLWRTSVWKGVLGILAPVGRMALTNYLLQTVVCVTLFYGYGFGYFGRFGALTSTLIALAIFAAQIVLSNIWLRQFNYGPMEWIWRQLTYGKRFALRKLAVP